MCSRLNARQNVVCLCRFDATRKKNIAEKFKAVVERTKKAENIATVERNATIVMFEQKQVAAHATADRVKAAAVDSPAGALVSKTYLTKNVLFFFIANSLKFICSVLFKKKKNSKKFKKKFKNQKNPPRSICARVRLR